MKRLTDQELVSVQNVLRNAEELGVGRIPALMIELLMVTGMRQEELANLTRDSFEIPTGLVHVQPAKNSKARAIPVNPVFMIRLAELKLAVGEKTVGLRFARSEDVESFKRKVRRWWKEILTLAVGLERAKELGAHSLRHTWAMRMLAALGNDVVKLQSAIGHKNLNSTRAYLDEVNLREMDALILKVMHV